MAMQTQQTLPHCIWMQAGVVNVKRCRRDYDCNGCRFDRILRRMAEENARRTATGTAPYGKCGRIVFWADKLKERPAHRRPCLHHLKGRIGFRACTNDYVCSNCEFDQYFQDQYVVHAVLKPVDVQQIQGIRVPHGVYLHRGHAWANLAADGQVRIGLDDFAVHMLGCMDRIDLPLMGKPLEQDQAGIGMRRGDLNARVLAPLSGVVTAFNPRVREDPTVLASDPYGDGWLLMLQPSRLREELRSLKMGTEATDFIESEIADLYQTLESQVGPLAADGGHLADDLIGSLPVGSWAAIARQILKG
jgi:glycine cleavage system H lipoate-binding protein